MSDTLVHDASLERALLRVRVDLEDMMMVLVLMMVLIQDNQCVRDAHCVELLRAQEV